ncbi:unnamed protein product [Caenorhabditis brenneri]
MIHCYVYVHQTQSGYSPDEVIAMLAFFDVFSTPLIIQVSYLLSNKSNAELLKRNMSVRRVYSIIFKDGTVEPTIQEVPHADVTSTRF